NLLRRRMRACGRRARSSLLGVTTATPASLVAALADLAYRLRRLATVGYYDRLLGACRRERRSAQSALLPDGIARRPWGRDLPRRTYSNRRYSSRAFCTCRRFSACSKITERGDSIASAVISSPRTAGRQCS